MAVRDGIKILLLTTLIAAAGCKSRQQQANEAAVEQARLMAAQTNSAMKVTTTDAAGNTVLTVVQPPAPGSKTQQISTTTVSKSTTSAGAAPVLPAIAPADAPVTPASTSDLNLSPGSKPGPAVDTTPAPVSGVVAPVIAPVDVQVARGTVMAIRVTQRISVKTAHAGDRFSGEVARSVVVDGRDVIPKGTPVEGRIDASHRRGHFKGRSILELRLLSMRLNGTRYELTTRDNVRTKKGKGKRSSAFIGGGAGVGMLIGGVATGGVGLLVGGLAGGGAGTLLGGLTGNRDLVIPAESVVDFRLADDLVVQPQ